ncbi:MAG TPA: sigma-70 family RNA polymerase sigma factor [Longimicrobiales bacterium]|nr:sigma-70 family RNA polymerase sigma factor [Longimicrobiales bacterium]
MVLQAHPLVRRWALVHTGDSADADDLTQDVLVHMIRRLDRYGGRSAFTTWLYAVTRNTVRDHLRARPSGAAP